MTYSPNSYYKGAIETHKTQINQYYFLKILVMKQSVLMANLNDKRMDHCYHATIPDNISLFIGFVSKRYR